VPHSSKCFGPFLAYIFLGLELLGLELSWFRAFLVYSFLGYKLSWFSFLGLGFLDLEVS
jgi:hypothetical protein